MQRFKSNYSNLLQSVGREVVQSLPLSGELLEQWSDALEATFPVADFGRYQLILYRFGGVRVKQLFLDSFGHDEDELEPTLKHEEPGDVTIGTLVKQDMSR